MAEKETYVQRARQRAKRRKSPWNLILIPLSVCGIVGTGFLLGIGLLKFQGVLIPDDAILSSYTKAGAIFMFVPILFPSLGIGMMLANLMAWCISPARRTFEREAKGIKDASFRPATKKLAVITLYISVSCLPLCVLGALNYFYVTEDGIHLNPFFSLRERHYAWDDIREIQTRCLAERDNLHLNYRLKMTDGTEVDLMEEPRLKFVRVYPRIRRFIEGHGDIEYSEEITNLGLRRLRSRYSAENAEKILSILRVRT